MATNGEESLGRTILRGAAWGIGFAIVSVPLGIALHAWLDPKPKGKGDEVDFYDSDEEDD